MKKFLVVMLTVAMIAGCAMTSLAAGSRSYSTKKTATTEVKGTGVSGAWNYNAATGTWSFADATKVYKAQWALVQNPYSNNAAQWYYFDAAGNMLTGWVWITGADGITRCYYLNPVSNGSLGACYLNGTTPDGYTVDANGAWTLNGKVVTK